jgi:hypothetical protein
MAVAGFDPILPNQFRRGAISRLEIGGLHS